MCPNLIRLPYFRRRSPSHVGLAVLLIAWCSVPDVGVVVAADPAAVVAASKDNVANPDVVYDVVIYGGTSAGIAAAVQAKRMNAEVIVLEPTRRIGGLTTGGLGQTDIGNKAAIGGVSREFYGRVRRHYNEPSSWKWQRKEEYRSGGQSRTSAQEETMWTFEPSAALAIMQRFVAEHKIPVIYEAPLDRTSTGVGDRVRGVEMDGDRIVAIVTKSGRQFRGKCFIDATYEGDLMAGAGVTFTVGREGNSEYGETLNGVQVQRSVHHQLRPDVDPYVVPNDPSSGLLPGIDPTGPGEEGSGDHRVQAYCFRMCLTDHPENRIPFTKPEGYDAARYELLFRNFEAGAKIIPWANSGMPNRKTDVNNNRGFSTDFIGANYDYPNADDAEREHIVARHRTYQQGLMWTLANHPRVPEAVRREVSRWGTCRDEFARDDGWQQQLYIREARRMIGDYVMTQHNCQGRVTAERSVGLAAYTMDSHNVQRYVDADGTVRNEGDVQVGGFSPYPIEYGSLVPKREECTNLFVPVCLSSTHMAFGSIRMEPVFMVLGQSAATAAVLANKAGTPVQNLDYAVLSEHLKQDGQVLVWTGPTRTPPQGIDPKTLAGIVVDDLQAKCDGFDSHGDTVTPFIGLGYRHDANTAKGSQSATFELQVPKAGAYEVRLAWSPHSNRATNVPVTVHHASGTSTVNVNQRKPPTDGAFGSLGTFQFAKGTVKVDVSNAGTDGYVIVDAVQLLPQPPNGTATD